MMKYKIIAGIFCLSGGLAFCPGRVAANDQSLSFNEVYDLLRTNLTGVDEGGLNRAAVKGLLNQLESQVTVVGEPGGTNVAKAVPAGIRTAMFEGAFGYIRVGSVEAGGGEKFKAAYQELASTNRLKGLVIDLRFAGGENYAAAAAMAEGFFSKEQPLIDWGEGVKKSAPNGTPIALPLAILVNRQTKGAAEAFSGILRLSEIGLLIGSPTAGRAHIAREFALKNGQRLRIAIAPVKVGDGKPMPVEGLKPDIRVDVGPDEELAHLEDAYKPLSKGPAGAGSQVMSASSTTNRTPRPRVNEAVLVRMLRDGGNPDTETNSVAPREPESVKQVIQDPALARALDLLKGLAVVQQFRSI